MFGYGILDLNKTAMPGLKFKLECLRSDDSDYKALKAVISIKRKNISMLT